MDARGLLELHRQLVHEEGGLDPFAPKALERIRNAPAVELDEEALSPRELLTVLRALSLQADEAQSRALEAEFVMTVPPALGRPTVRSTFAAVTDLIETAKAEVIAIGYEMTDQRFVKLLGAAVLRGLQVVVVCDELAPVLDTFEQGWPKGVRHPRLYAYKQQSGGGCYDKMHGKALFVDYRRALITSANFTKHGLDFNIEVGVQLSGQQVEEGRTAFIKLLGTPALEKVELP